MMNKDEVERWLCAPGNPVPSPATVAGLLGLPVAQVADTTLLRTARHVQSLRFTLALLRDRFDSDCDVRDWLDEPRCDLDGLSPRRSAARGALRGGRGAGDGRVAARAARDAGGLTVTSVALTLFARSIKVLTAR